MSDHEPMGRDVALAAASEILALLDGTLEKTTLAGSLRRGLETVNDVEIVGLSRMVEMQPGLFFGITGTAQRDLCSARVDELIGAGTFAPRLAKDGKQAIGARYKRLWYRPAVGISIPLDLLTPAPESYGAQLAIQTGPRGFSRLCVTHRADGGAMPFGMKQEGGALWRGGNIVPTPEEATWFEEIELPWWDPAERSEQRLRDYLREQRMAARA